MQKKDINGLTEQEFLGKYDPTMFERLSMSVDTVIFSIDTKLQTSNYRKLDDQKLTVLLVKRNEHPFLEHWSLPGGFIGVREAPAKAARRVLRNKTGLDDLYIETLGTYGEPDRDPRMRIISSTYLSLLDRDKFKLQASPYVADSAWFEVEVTDRELVLCGEGQQLVIPYEKAAIRNGKIKTVEYQVTESNPLAFDHGKILLDGLMRLRHKIDDTDIVFNLLPEEFTITQLQQIYEIILGGKLLAPAFRRKIAPKLQETGRYVQEKGHRPSQYFMYKE